MSIFKKVADAHAAARAVEEEAARKKAQDAVDKETHFERAFEQAVNSQVLPFFVELKGEIEAEGYPVEVKSGIHDPVKPYIEIRFTPNKSAAGNVFGLDGRNACVFRIKAEKSFGRIEYTAFFNQFEGESGQSGGFLVLDDLTATKLQRHLEEFFAKSFNAASNRPD